MSTDEYTDVIKASGSPRIRWFVANGILHSDFAFPAANGFHLRIRPIWRSKRQDGNGAPCITAVLQHVVSTMIIFLLKCIMEVLNNSH